MVTLNDCIVQARYLEFETQKKARGDEQGLET